MEIKTESQVELARHEKEMKILRKMFAELKKADSKYVDDKMSPEELECSFLTLKCEVTELERETKRKTLRPKAMEKEGIQSLAMAFKFCRDVIYADE